jgi:hypothetical protein
MKSRWVIAIAAIFCGVSDSADAGEAWNCAWVTPNGWTEKGEGRFEVNGTSLKETYRDVILDYQILENNKDAVVVAEGGSSVGGIMASVVMIRKGTGEFAFTTTSIGGQSERQTGTCSRENSN